jgi:hypothetical protein
MKRIHSSNSIFLMEIILNILLFSVLLVIGLQFFMQAHLQTQQTQALHQAVTSCESVAALFQSGDGTLEGLAADCAYSTVQNNEVNIYLDGSFAFCPKQDAAYSMTAALSSGENSGLSKLTVTCFTQTGGQELYSLTACRYTPQQSALLELPQKEVA